MDGAAVTDALDSHEERNALAVLGLAQNQDGADLRDGLRQDGGREHRVIPRAIPEVPLVERDVLDADDSLVGLELGHAIHEQERIAVRQNPFNGRVVERKL
jgi:hypothetical protein